MRIIHDCLGKLDMQRAGVTVAELVLMFQYIACRINKIPFGIKNIHTYSEEKIQNLRQGTELITFVCPADWMMFQVPNGLDFTGLENSTGEAIKSTIEKLETIKMFRKGEFLELLNKQYPNMSLSNPKKVKVNSVVLVRNIANEPKREPLKLARIVKVHDSRDDTQRVVTLTY